MTTKHLGKQFYMNYGFQREKDLKPIIENIVGEQLNLTEQFDRFDYVGQNEKIKVELKSRRMKHNQYPDIMVSYGKIVEAKKLISRGYKIYFCFNCEDGLFYTQYTGGALRRGQGGNFQNGERSKDLSYFPISKLKRFPYAVERKCLVDI